MFLNINEPCPWQKRQLYAQYFNRQGIALDAAIKEISSSRSCQMTRLVTLMGVLALQDFLHLLDKLPLFGIYRTYREAKFD